MIPINVDTNVNKNDYGDKIAVSSIFYSLQGEGPYSGQPFMFIRLAGCNFGSKTQTCTQCDTQFQMAKATWYTVEELYEHLKQVAECHNIILTGGEPTLQPQILKVLEKWISDYPNCLIQIETNGTQPHFFADPLYKRLMPNIKVCCSPKCNEVTGRYQQVPAQVVLYVDFFKFLVSADPTNCYHKLPDYVDGLHCLVYVSPITVYKQAPESEVASIWDHELIDEQQTAKNYAYAAQLVMYPKLVTKHQLYLSLQTHLFTAIA